MYVNWTQQEIYFKIVYYGPSFSGKTTNLEMIHSKIHRDLKTDLVELNTKEDRTIYFDFFQFEGGGIDGKKPRFNLYTIPGLVLYASTKKLILQRVDGVVFVADSEKGKMDANIQSLQDLAANIEEMGLSLRDFPFVLQYNKRDLRDTYSLETMQGRLNWYDVPHFTSIANQGKGIFETLKEAINQVIKRNKNG